MKNQTGATLVELVISIVIIATVSTSAMMLVAQTTGRSADPLIRIQAFAIAEAYMEEIISQPITDPSGGDSGGVETGEDPARRDLFDDVTDYAVINDQTGAKNQSNDLVSGLSRYNVEVTVSTATLNGSPAKRILVEVSHDADPTVVYPLVAYRLN